jgi:hypothetical protein
MMPSRKAIYDYWVKAGGIADMEDFDHDSCFACGWAGGVDRAHIISRASGGGESPGNLVLLCRRCHHEAPDLDDLGAMLRFIKTRELYLYRMIRLFNEGFAQGSGEINTVQLESRLASAHSHCSYLSDATFIQSVACSMS